MVTAPIRATAAELTLPHLAARLGKFVGRTADTQMVCPDFQGMALEKVEACRTGYSVYFTTMDDSSEGDVAAVG
ncbi:hypothetical protein GWI34_27970 [Actinomadura sp. DSM 109109]|nr:hypothetical protein [Actinomadura lepetitiana]